MCKFISVISIGQSCFKGMIKMCLLFLVVYQGGILNILYHIVGNGGEEWGTQATNTILTASILFNQISNVTVVDLLIYFKSNFYFHPQRSNHL